MELHKLRTWPDEFWAVKFSDKTFDYRKNDRDFKIGDLVLLKEYDPDEEMGNEYTGQRFLCEITYIIDGAVAPKQYGIPAEYCILGLNPVDLINDPSDDEEDINYNEDDEENIVPNQSNQFEKL